MLAYIGFVGVRVVELSGCVLRLASLVKDERALRTSPRSLSDLHRIRVQI